MFRMIEIPTTRFSSVVLAVGVILGIISFFMFVFEMASGSLMYGNANFLPVFTTFLSSLVLIIIGNKKIVDPDQLIIFLKDFCKKEK